MFGIGGTELVVIAIVLLIAVGPSKLPKLLKAVVKGYSELRRATRELRASTGIDEILQDEDLKDLRKPIYIPPPNLTGAAKTAVAPAARPKLALGSMERAREDPPEGVDVAEIREAALRPSPAEAESIRAAKDAVIQAKLNAALGPAPIVEAPPPPEDLDPEERQRRIDQKLAAAPPPEDLDPEERQRRIDQKLAAAPPREDLDPEERQRRIDQKLAAASRSRGEG